MSEYLKQMVLRTPKGERSMDYMDMKPFLEGWNKGFDDGMDFIKTQIESDEFAEMVADQYSKGKPLTGMMISKWLSGKEDDKAELVR
jgi:hypothetical protein